MDANAWSERYAASEQVWSREPNMLVEEMVHGLDAGRAVDLAAGEGRNAIWLAQQGWQVDALDFSQVAVDRCAALAERAGVADRVRARVADATTEQLEPGYDLALLSYLQLPEAELTAALTNAIGAVRPAASCWWSGTRARTTPTGTAGRRAPTSATTRSTSCTRRSGSRSSSPRRRSATAR